ncbi:MAG: hypothetical protein H8E13_18040 [Actinobacteria bacterium]|nr:hypothetical protein [Actinomycetota bacterium]
MILSTFSVMKWEVKYKIAFQRKGWPWLSLILFINSLIEELSEPINQDCISSRQNS